jgi:uncharacterized membrane protein YfcA
METAGGYALLLVAGTAAGALNVIAGGGSFLTLPVLMFLGLPPGIANATNRLGIVVQDLAAVWSFDRSGVLDRGSALWAALPATLGAGLGALLALRVSDALFVRLLALLMIALSLGSLWTPSRPEAGRARGTGTAVARTGGFFLVGIYGGFVQAGVGFLFVALTTLVGLDLVRGNAVKVLSILPMTALALAIFAWNGRVEWVTGSVLAVGFLVGGLLGARWTVLKGHRWVRGIVTAAILLLALKLLLTF